MSLSELPNIGPELERRLEAAGIQTPERLREIGAVAACRMVAAGGEDTPCANMLFALEGAIRGVRWHAIPKSERDELLLAFRDGA